MADRREPRLDLLFVEIASPLAFGKSRQGERQREQVEKLSVTALCIRRRLAGLIGGHGRHLVDGTTTAVDGETIRDSTRQLPF